MEMNLGRLLIDPYAKQLSHALNWDREAYIGETRSILGESVKDNQAFIPKSIVTASASHEENAGGNDV